MPLTKLLGYHGIILLDHNSNHICAQETNNGFVDIGPKSLKNNLGHFINIMLDLIIYWAKNKLELNIHSGVFQIYLIFNKFKPKLKLAQI